MAEDLELALGEAAANAVEHAYPAGTSGEFTYDLARCDDGMIRVAVRDFGRWRDEPLGNHHRGRGLQLIRSLASNVTLTPSPTGTEIHFQLLPLRTPPGAPRETSRAERAPAPPRIDTEFDGQQLQVIIHGDLDLAGVTAIRAELHAQLTPVYPIVVDLRPTRYLASAGVALLTELAGQARQAGVEWGSG